ncbi:hypothetical protein GH714_041764 [Hevea brasiliensis]|uniref:Pentatricopeptide repeat-containing protein n=1 Tax=Hevea brasiliensis TaxID=3981 RepID=A0A6A6MW52_HEVBR|nr:hypothetical protein GH714_041764 [Hevea brasiliensis]
MQVHTHVLKFGLELDLHVVNGLVRGYCVSSHLSSARRLFDEFSERDLSIWTTMITGYAQNFCAIEALVLFDRMLVEGFEPNGSTVASVLSACARSGCLELGERIHAFMLERGVQMGVILGTALVHMKLEKEDLVPNDVTFVGVLSACCHAGLIDVGYKIFNSMKEVYGIEPKIEHYGCMVDLLGRGGKLVEAEELIKRMAWKAML